MKLEDFIATSESSDVPEGTESLLHRRFKRGVPDFPHHVVATYRGAGRALQLACYIHFTDCGDILLGGGDCTDERVLPQMSLDERELLRTAGGIYQHVLRWSVSHFAPF